MEESNTELRPESAALLDLGVAVGENRAFALVAGRCSAAQAESLKRIRERKDYRQCVATWRDFCPKYLNISGAQADRIIALWDEFGAGYFELAQLTRVSAETFRAIEPNLKDRALHWNGEAISLEPENAQIVAAAVAEVRAALPPKAPPELTLQDRVAELERRCRSIIEEFDVILFEPHPFEDWLVVNQALTRTTAALARLEIEGSQR